MGGDIPAAGARIAQDRWHIKTPDQAPTARGFLVYLLCSSSVTNSFGYYGLVPLFQMSLVYRKNLKFYFQK